MKRRMGWEQLKRLHSQGILQCFDRNANRDLLDIRNTLKDMLKLRCTFGRVRL